ncbi:DinI-like family protein [Citrobacter freundii]|uniref:DinI-like family protein n=1 Tax=Citrobacter freundii TaxID=546 RepID=UPI002E14ABF8
MREILISESAWEEMTCLFAPSLDKDQKIGQPIIDAFQCELTRRIQSVFPSTRVTVKKGSITGVELMGFDKDSDREALDSILQEVWEDESWR